MPTNRRCEWLRTRESTIPKWSCSTLRRLLNAVAFGLTALGCAPKGTGVPPANQPIATNQPEPPREASDVAVPRSVEQPWMSLKEWRARHESQLAANGRAQAQVALVGDSITQMWADTEAYRSLASYQPLNLGIGGDQTQHVLWRLQQGSLAGTSPRVVVLLIGVNNLGNGHEPAETARGVLAVVGAIRQAVPTARILLLGILPTGALPTDPMRAKVSETNRLLASATLPVGTSFHDIGAPFVEPDGRIGAETMADALHPTPSGFVRLTQAVLPLIEQAIGAPQ